MSGFRRCGGELTAIAPDPRKRVNFVEGLVLGADDLSQESAFLANRAEWLARDLVGYGTVWGLRVTADTLAGDRAGVVVSSGLALSPRGRPISVGMAQAVALDDWLNARGLGILPFLTPGPESPPGDLLRLYVVLVYGQCPTDDQPAAGEPCRTDEPPRLFTRIADTFRLELRESPPDQSHDDAVRDLARWLGAIEVVDAGTAMTVATLDELLDTLRDSALGGSPPSLALASPPAALRVDAADVGAFFRAALRVWVTELRPLWRTLAPEDDAVLLAEVEVPLTTLADGRWRVESASRLAIREERRPYLLPLRLVQELALVERAPAAAVPRVDAAGIVKGSIDSSVHRRPRVGDLRVTAVADGSLTILFDGYTPPAVTGTFQYVVKALAHQQPCRRAQLNRR